MLSVKIKREKYGNLQVRCLLKLDIVGNLQERTFTIVGNRCPLTRITSSKVVPLKETTIEPVITPTSELKTLRTYYEEVGISHQTSVARTPQQNCVVKRWNSTLVEAARTMLIFSKALLFLWAEGVATACYTQN
ncbi:putative ribonuclease H-like domain-containing protein [Tanacetum coccineum]|uniref:Ribonuclease H-like domain-containing protein n=1 Tax=Tanacetum coccineum TaxID=301880 RepID=A0ABQ4XPG5_9ASTR